jgi:hypothetical protein
MMQQHFKYTNSPDNTRTNPPLGGQGGKTISRELTSRGAKDRNLGAREEGKEKQAGLRKIRKKQLDGLTRSRQKNNIFEP